MPAVPAKKPSRAAPEASRPQIVLVLQGVVEPMPDEAQPA
jgi:hypothetical protein